MNKVASLINPKNETQINQLIDKMTLEEKLGQLNQAHPYGEPPNDAIRLGRIGSIINAASALAGQNNSPAVRPEVSNELQRQAVEKSRLGIPLLFGRDVIHGYRTVLPIPLGQAAAWDPGLVQKGAEIAAREATADGIKWTYAPMIDIARDPRWGRVAEGAGEDPYLGSVLAAAAVRGFQGNDFSKPDRLIACAKHYVGYGGAEGGRDYESAEISLPILHDIYLPPYQAAVEAGVATIMSAFHDLNGMPMTAHRHLLTHQLRILWGFQGFVVSDWKSIAELIPHGIARDGEEAAQKALLAGVDMDMLSETYLHHLTGALQNGLISMEDIDLAVHRILRIKYAAGLFDHPYTDPSKASSVILSEEHRQLAREFAAKTMVLLKNNCDLLPIQDNTRNIAFVGPMVHAQSELYGTWTPDGRPEDVLPLSEAIQRNAPGEYKLSFASALDDAVYRAANADVVVVLVGEHPTRSGENANVSSLDLPPGQTEFIQAVANQGTPMILVVMAGRPLAIPRETTLAGAVLYIWHPGIEGGSALADVLFGKIQPGGKLPISIPRTTGQVPVYYNRKNSGRPAGEGLFLRRYVDLPLGPLYPFGYGLSYTRYEYSHLRLNTTEMTDQLEVSVKVSNQGNFAGEEIAQLYIRDLFGQITRPVKELKGFIKVPLLPGETKQIVFRLRRDDLKFSGMDGEPVIEPGDYHVWVGPNSAEGLQESFQGWFIIG